MRVSLPAGTVAYVLAGAVSSNPPTHATALDAGVPATHVAPLPPTINVRDFGALGDGIADDTKAIQAALDAALTGPRDPSAGVRVAARAVYVPSGNYRITAPLKVWSAARVTIAGAGINTRFLAGAPMSAVFDLNGVALSTFHDFSIGSLPPENSNTFDTGIYLYWDKSTAARSTSWVRFSNIAVFGGKWKQAFQIGKVGSNLQVSETEWYDCNAVGNWVDGETTWWQAGFAVGSRVYANNLNHAIFSPEVSGVRYGVYDGATNVTVLGGMIQRTEVDIYGLNIHGYLSAGGFRSEGSQRLFVGVQSSNPKHVSLHDIIWVVTKGVAADRRIIDSAQPGSITLQGVTFTTGAGGEGAHPRLRITNPEATLILDGVSVGGGSTLSETVEVPPAGRVLIRGFSEMDNHNVSKKQYGEVVYSATGIAFGRQRDSGMVEAPDVHVSRSAAGLLGTDKGLQHMESTPRPPCDSSHRGALWYTQAATGAKDSYAVCIKDAAESYGWQALF